MNKFMRFMIFVISIFIALYFIGRNEVILGEEEEEKKNFSLGDYNSEIRIDDDVERPSNRVGDLSRSNRLKTEDRRINDNYKKNDNFEDMNEFVNTIVKPHTRIVQCYREPVTLNNIGCLPQFIIIGAPKSGTTSLFQYLRDHPKVAFNHQKELNFFVPKHKGETSKHYALYFPDLTDPNKKMGNIQSKYIKDKNGAKQNVVNFNPFFPESDIVTGEGTPTYLYGLQPFTIQDMDRIVPNVKLIFIFREPLARAFSSYNMWLAFKAEGIYPKLNIKTFSEYINMDMKKINNCLASQEDEYIGTILPNKNNPACNQNTVFGQFGFIGKGIFVDAIKKYTDVFRKDQILFLLHDDLDKDGQEVMNEVDDFLDLEPHNYEKVLGTRTHSSGCYVWQKSKEKGCAQKVKPKDSIPPWEKYNITRELYDEVRAFYKPFNERLGEVIGKHIPWDD